MSRHRMPHAGSAECGECDELKRPALLAPSLLAPSLLAPLPLAPSPLAPSLIHSLVPSLSSLGLLSSLAR